MSFIVIAVLQEKGGTRKTFVSAHLSPWLTKHGVEHTLVDVDISAGHLLLVYPSAVSLKFNAEGVQRLKALISEKRNLVLDFGANSSAAFYEHIDQQAMLSDTVRSLGGKFTIVSPVETAPKGQFFASRYRAIFPYATVIVARPLTNGNTPPPLPPGHPPELCFDIPELSGRRLLQYQANFKPLDQLAIGQGSLASAARSYLRVLFSQFDRVKEHLLP